LSILESFPETAGRGYCHASSVGSERPNLPSRPALSRRRSLGILLDVVDPAQLMPRAMELAHVIAAKPAHSVRLAKRLLRYARSMDLSGFLEFSAALQAVSHHTDAHREAVAAFQRRP
jgi:enoyl-CoA hydratase/carnithine racemase